MRRVAALCGFLSVLVYPAIPLGASSGLPFIELLGLLTLWLLIRRRGPSDSARTFALLVLPLVVSGLAATLGGWAVEPSIAAKTAITLALAMSCLALPDLLPDRPALLGFLDGLAAGVLLHAGFGVLQLWDFSRGHLSFLWLYESNPGLPFNAAVASDYVHYIHRPWGLFPEPSAMTASLGPLLLLLLETGLSELPGGARRTLYLFATACGITLVVASRSGYAVFLALAAGALLVARVFRGRSRRPLHALAGALLLTFGGLLLVAISLSVLGDRTELGHNTSWVLRWRSLGASLSLLFRSPGALLFGAGAGQSFLFLQQSGIAAATGVTAIWSVLLTYVSETGLVGLGALLLVFARLLRALGRSARPFAGWVMWGAWLLGAGFTTSYPSLPPLWLTLGILLSWDRLFAPVPKRARVALAPLPQPPAARELAPPKSCA